MSMTVKEFIERKEAQVKEDIDKQRKDMLISLGLFEKVYSDKEGLSSEYPYTDDNDKNYKIVALDVTDNEYIKILELSKQENDKENKIGNLLIAIAWTIYCIGFMAGIISGGSGDEFSVIIMFEYWVSSFISGTLFISFAEVIKLLHKISLK